MASIRKRTWRSAGETKTAWTANYTDQAGRRRLKTFATKKAADAWLLKARGEMTGGIHVPERESIIVGEAGDAWLAQAEADGLERSTLTAYRQHLALHIKPFLGAVRIAQLTPAAVQSYRNQLANAGRSRAMVKRVTSSLSSILGHAMATGQAARNVVREQRHTRRRHGRLEQRHERRLEVGVDIPTKKEIRAMLAAAEGRWRPLLVTAVFTGLRASELRGLRWADVDLDGAELTVRQRADKWGAIGSPKSDAGKRTVPLAPMVVNALREWRLACPKGPFDLVFPNTKGKPEYLAHIHYRFLAPLQAAVGIIANDREPQDGDRKETKPKARRPRYAMHSFRHAAASMFIEQGFTPKRVQALMGHSTIQMTFDTYGHLFPSPVDDQAAMRQLQARLIG
jgi:integrase